MAFTCCSASGNSKSITFINTAICSQFVGAKIPVGTLVVPHWSGANESLLTNAGSNASHACSTVLMART
jgi:hypothetical protein